MASSSRSIDVPGLVESIRNDLAALPRMSPTAFIYRVPKELRTGNEKCFTPTTVSIGPLHAQVGPQHAQVSSLVASNNIKTRYLNSFLSRLPQDKSLKHVVDVLHGLEEEARSCYAETISLSREEFIRLMLIDGCFILQLLWRHENKQVVDQDDPIFHTGRAKWAMLYNLQQDLLLLENQLPFFVLYSLYELVASDQQDNPRQSLANSVINFFDSVAPIENLKHRNITRVKPKHLLDLVMFSLFPRPSHDQAEAFQEEENHPEDIIASLEEGIPRPSNDQAEAFQEEENHPEDIIASLEEGIPRPSNDQPEALQGENHHPLDIISLLEVDNYTEIFVDVRSASELELSGVKFTNKSSKKCSYLSDITFHDGVLSVPTVVFLDSTATLFWNLLALEQCSDFKEYGCVFISYVSFMDNLICSNKDVEVFVKNGMILSWVNGGDKEFLLLFNRLALAADMDGVNEFSHISHQLERYCKRGIHPLRAYLVGNYFEVRWDLMNTVMLFIFTVTQTVFAILDYNRKGKR